MASSQPPRSASSSSSPSFAKSHSEARTPSAVDFPGAFTTHPKQHTKRHISVGQIMKGGVAETVSGSLANVVGGVYSIVNYVNPLGAAAKPADRAQDPQREPDSGHSSAGGEPRVESPPLMLHAPSAGTSVAADLDEHCLADANADNPESNRPPTPTKTSFTRMLRFPAASADPAASAEYKQAVQNDPVSRNVSQRTGLQFRPGAEEKRRYTRRMSKAPQLTAEPPRAESEPVRRSASNPRRKHSLSSAPSTQDDRSADASDASDDDSAASAAPAELEAAELAQFYQAAASSQRSHSKFRAIEPWRFIAPRVKRVKRRVLWRLFLAQELAPAVYDEAASIASSPAVSPQAARGPVPPMPRSPAATADPAADSASLRRRMLATRAAADDASQRSVAARDSHGRLRQRTPSIAPSVNSLSSAAATAPALPSDASRQKNAVWTMEFSVCGRYLAAGGQDGVLRVWRIAPFAREQAAEKRQQHGPESPASAVHDSRLEPAAARTRAASNHAAAADAGRSHVRQKSAMYADGAEMMPFANSAPIAKGKHLRSFSVGQPMLPARGEPQTSPTGSAADAAPAAPANDRAPAAPEPTAQLHPMHAYELLEPVPFRSYVGHAADILALAWSKNGFLLSASTDRTVRLWHPHRPECLCTFRHRDIVTSVAFNPRDDRLFISGSLDCRLRLWDIPARSVRHWTRLPEGQMVTSVAFTSSRGDYIVAGTYRGMCVFYSTDGLAVQGRMHARSSRGRNAKGSKITGFAHAPTGQMPPALLKRLLGPSHFESLLAHPRLLVSSNDSRLRMFLPGERDLARKYKGHANVSSQAYARLSSDGRYIVSGSEDHNVYVWPAAQDNAATVATHPNSDHIRRVGRAAPVAALNGSHAGRPEKQPLLASLFGRKRNQHEQHEPKPDTPEPQSEEWESLDGKVEEKSIYEYFPAHDAVVSQALFAPAATLQYLADHDDPILSRRKMRRTKSSGDVENVLPASPNATFGSGSIQVPAADDNDDDDDLKHSVEDMTAIIVSADTRGNIRVFRKDINVRRSYAGAENPSHTSLVKAKESMNSLTRAITGDGKNPLEPGDLDIYTMTPAHTAEHKVPPPLQQQHQHGSFWDRLGRRMSQKRHSSTYAGPSKPAAADSRPKARAVSEIHDSVPPSLAAIAEASSGSLEKQAGTSDDVCAHCGNDKFIDFAVAPTASSSAAAPRQLSISVCEKCKHVKNLPV